MVLDGCVDSNMPDEIYSSGRFHHMHARVVGGGMSAVYMLNSVGERTPPCGTPVLN